MKQSHQRGGTEHMCTSELPQVNKVNTYTQRGIGGNGCRPPSCCQAARNLVPGVWVLWPQRESSDYSACLLQFNTRAAQRRGGRVERQMYQQTKYFSKYLQGSRSLESHVWIGYLRGRTLHLQHLIPGSMNRHVQVLPHFSHAQGTSLSVTGLFCRDRPPDTEHHMCCSSRGLKQRIFFSFIWFTRENAASAISLPPLICLHFQKQTPRTWFCVTDYGVICIHFVLVRNTFSGIRHANVGKRLWEGVNTSSQGVNKTAHERKAKTICVCFMLILEELVSSDVKQNTLNTHTGCWSSVYLWE